MDKRTSIPQTRKGRRKITRNKNTIVTIYKMWQEKDDVSTKYGNVGKQKGKAQGNKRVY